jgi:hypothetical protein
VNQTNTVYGCGVQGAVVRRMSPVRRTLIFFGFIFVVGFMIRSFDSAKRRRQAIASGVVLAKLDAG